MNEILYNILALIAGGMIGTLFFGGLWITVKEGTQSKNPALWFLGSFILRLTIAMTGFYYVSQGSWQRSMICLVGFIIVRIVIIRHTHALTEKRRQINKEADHEA